MRFRPLVPLAAVVALASCQAAVNVLAELFEERPPSPLDRLSPTSDLRVDSLGRIAGTLVGHGTPRSVHLLTSDTTLIANLVRTYRPGLLRGDDLWSALARARVVSVSPRRSGEDPASGPSVEIARAGSPLGHTEVIPTTILLRGSGCGWRGAQAEIVVEEQRPGRGWARLEGPVAGSLRIGSEVRGFDRGFVHRDPPPAPSPALTDELLARTARAIDSAVSRSLPERDLPLANAGRGRLDVNTLEDIDAADVLPVWIAADRHRYAVALRARRLTPRGDTLLVAGLMVWDSAGAWTQHVFHPTVLQLRRGRLVGWRGAAPVFWRRLEAVTGFGTGRDYLWMEQVSPADGTVLWALLAPRSNTAVAAAEVGGPCS